MRSNSLPSGHIDLNRRHPCLEEDLLEGVLVTKVPSAPFGLEVIKDKTTEDVERLSKVGEAASVVCEEPRRSSLRSMTFSPKSTNGQEGVKPSAFHLSQILL